MFGKTKTAEEILGMIEKLPEDEKEKVLSTLNSSQETPPVEETETEESEEVKEESEEPEEESRTDEETTSETADTEEESEPEEESVEEEFTEEETVEEQPSEATDEPEVKDDGEDRFKALIARLDSLEAIVNDLRQAQADAVEEEHNQDFGLSPDVPVGETENNRMDAVLRGYAKGKSNQYM